ncbi:MAG: hypothetical protein MUC36_19645 [Planctomycetes bacterium]|nr:hypothetical protein [Planctomycetota bacterium]
MPAVVLFALSLAAQLLFRVAGPDGGAGWHIGFQGDAPVWQDLAHKLAGGIDDVELRLPWRPPGMQWLVAMMWNGDPAGAWLPRLVMNLCAAATAPLLWLWLRDKVARRTALLAAGLCAFASNVLLLGSGVHAETVYLPAVLAMLLVQDRLLGVRGLWWSLMWGAGHGALCLLRAEHVLSWLVFAAVARLGGAAWRHLLFGAVASATVLVPWQLHANALVDTFNQGSPALPPSPLPWDQDAVTRLRSLPAFQQGPVLQFVGDTMRTRGAGKVGAADLDVVREAYGCWPEPLPHAFVALYGGLNFFLANSPEAAGGFSRAALDRPPPLSGGDKRYPRGLRQVLPRGGQLAFAYPPHLDAVVHGTALGFAELTADPRAAAGRIATKLWHAAQGATFGLGGHALPIGLSGERRQVDLVTAHGPWAASWRVLMLAAAAVGLWPLRKVRRLWPLFAFAATKLVVVAGWFGYARQGALCLPLIALGIAAAIERLPGAARLRARHGWLAALALLVLEGVRASTVTATVDEREVKNGEPFGGSDFSGRRIKFR